MEIKCSAEARPLVSKFVDIFTSRLDNSVSKLKQAWEVVELHVEIVYDTWEGALDRTLLC